MKNNKKIGWQKYEDYVEKQISSPFLNNIIKALISQRINEEDILEDEEDISDDMEQDIDLDTYEDEDGEEPSVKNILGSSTMLPLTPQLIEDISLISNFDCWIGHTNFDLTHSIRDKLDKIDGIEVLKVWSRYRFFVGIGKMFDFTDVRNNIEKILIQGEEEWIA